MYTLIPLSNSKPIFAVQEDPTLFGKGGVTAQEESFQHEAAELGLAPPIYSETSYNGERILLMKRIQGMCLADFYGEDVSAIPTSIWEQVRNILQTLWNVGIVYPDITGYNFIVETDTEKVWVIDFGHARRVSMVPCLRNILAGQKTWNEEYQ